MSDGESVPREPASVRVARHVYRQWLRLLPRTLRTDCGAEMEAEFVAMARQAGARGGAARVFAALACGVLDVLSGAVRERFSRRRPYGIAGGGPGWRKGHRERLEDMGNEIRLAVRALRRRPGFSVVAALTLALGIGANVAIFTVVDSVLLEPLPYPESDRIVTVRHHAPGLNLQDLENSAGTLEFYRETAQTITRMAGYDDVTRNLAGLAQPDRVQVVRVTPEFFDVMGVRPVIGRSFVESDGAEGAPPVLILLDRAWRTRFGADRSRVGSTVLLEGASTEIVGVMPPDFVWRDADAVALMPLELDPQRRFGTFGITGIARLAGGVEFEEAHREIDALQARIPDRWPDVTAEFQERAGWSVSLHRMKDLMIRDIRATLWILFGTVGVVLLIAGANVANLFLVRADSRQREIAVRSALGAGRRRLATSFLAESIVLAFVGGIAGTALAWAGTRVLVTRGPASLPRLHELTLDGAALAFALMLTVVTALVLAFVPVGRSAGMKLADALREGGRSSTTGRARHRVRKVLIAGQVALALVLLVGSGLMLRSAFRLRAVDPGFDPHGVITAAVSLGPGTSAAANALFYQRVVDEVAALPGVESSGATNSLPLQLEGMNGGSFMIEGRPRADDELPPVAMNTVITPGFFETLRVPVLEGRGLERRDHEGGPPVVLVNQAFATRFLEGRAIGERVRFGDDTVWAEIVGVVGDIRTFGLREEVRPMAYHPMTTSNPHVSIGLMFFAARTRLDPAGLVPAIRRIVENMDANVPVTAVRTLDGVVAASLAESTFATLLLAIAAGVALLLGVIGLYGVISYVVGQRRHEIAVRIALGAKPAVVRGMVLRQGMGVTTAGVLIGLGAAVGVSRLMASLLFEVSARDPFTFAAVAALLISVSLLATWLPARRAAAVDPLVALREE
ncbi:MAG: ABC transporter permease [Gemmatimonadetes bacterium]|nr:ABC transporter permease [Gemmatimonadota bacterium]